MITLLNGEAWNRYEILQKMADDSFYYGHLGQHALSSSSLKKLLESPKAYQASLSKSESHQAFRDGRLIHLAILEPEKMDDLIVLEGTKARKEFKQATAEHGDHVVYTRSEVDSAYWVAEAIKENNEAQFLLDGCIYEQAGVGEIEGLPFRAKADAINVDAGIIVDLKTTSSDVNDFHWAAKNYSYDLQAALYLEIFGANEFVFLVINKSSKDIGIFECSAEFIERGQDKIRHAISVYKQYFNQPNTDELIKNYVIRGIL